MLLRFPDLRPILFACLSALALAARAEPAQPPREISPLLIGTNVWYGDPDPKVWQLTADAGTRLIRIGGHAYDKKLPDEKTLVGWIKKIRAGGAEPLLQVSQYESPEKAARLVRDFNKRRIAGQPVLYWNIGNEPWLQNGRPDFGVMPEKIAAYFKAISAAMKAVDPKIKIFGPDECAFFPKIYEPLFGGAHDIAGKVPGKSYYYCDGLSWHRYPQTTNEPGLAEIEDFRTSIVKVRALIDRVNARHGRRGSDALQWGLGEFNAMGGQQVHTFGNGQMFGAVYGYSAAYGATYVASWSMYENSGSRRGSDFSGFDAKDFTPRASYWHQRFYGEYFSGLTVPARSNQENVLVFAAHDKKAGRLAVMIINLNDAKSPAAPYELRLDETGAPFRGLVLTLDLKTRNTFAHTIEPRSTQVLVFEKSTLKKITYHAADFDAGRPPTAVTQVAPFALPR
jgi:hypothetical protein